jgi:hypothetical protein
MVDVLRALIDALCRFAPALAGRREDKKLRRIGARLFLIYIRLVETLMTADRIVDSLEYFAENPENRFGWDHIADSVKEQALNVARLRQLLDDNAKTLILLDGAGYARLVPFLHMKLGFLRGLEVSLRGGQLPLGSSEGQLDALMDQAADLAAALAAEQPDVADEQIRLEVVVQRHMNVQPGLELIFGDPLDTPLRSEARAETVQRYLDVRKPRDELARLKDATAALGKTLTEHFSVDEILLEVEAGLRRRDR